DCSNTERILFSLPTRSGGLGIRLPTESAALSYSTSRSATQVLTDAIKFNTPFTPYDHICQVHLSRRDHSNVMREADKSTFSNILSQLDTNHQRTILRSKDSLSSWLSVLPTTKDNFDLSCTEFRDAICLRYSKPLLELPPNCDGCSSEFTTSHALDCKKGGLVTLRHNEVRDLLCDMSSLAWSQVVKEPVIRESHGNCEALIGDISARGIWQSQATAVFDVRVIDSDAPSYRHMSPKAVLKSAETAKKNKYSSACESIHTSFTPLCFTIDGLVGVEANTFLKKLAERLSLKWDQPYGQVIYWVRKRLSFALLRATGLCLRGTRSKLRSIHFEDGAGISPHSNDY
uniref:Uncharacterized protein n=1 Tax=Amphimedon queenslandica TaxID=400682 RepID=A0A1X7UHG6_AMPQE